MASPILPVNNPEDTQDDDSVFLDLLAAPFRGVEGAVQGIYNLADFVAFDILPDYDEKFLGRSTTVAGSAVEGISQFMTGFVPIFGWAGRAGAAAKAGSMTQKALGGTVRRGVVAGAVTDFTMFNGQEARLSNFIQQYPELQNPVTEFLAHDDEEGEIAGRLKNVLEGLGLEAVTFSFIKGLKAMKRGKKVRAEGGTPDDVYKGMEEELGGDLASVRPTAPKGIVAYHGGTAGKTFEAQPGGDLGFHFGSKEAAQERISRVGGKGEVQEYVLDINNPLRLNDPISFRGRGEGGRKFKQELKDAGIDIDVSKDYSREELTQLIKDQGYDGIVYKNAAEGVKEGKFSDSYVALDADQIKQSDGLGQQTKNLPDFDEVKLAEVASSDQAYNRLRMEESKRLNDDYTTEEIETYDRQWEGPEEGVDYERDYLTMRMARMIKEAHESAANPYDDAVRWIKEMDLNTNQKLRDELNDRLILQKKLADRDASYGFSDLPDLMDGKAFDEVIEARPAPQPYKTNLKAKRGLEGSRGSEAIKKRLRLEANLKNADPSDVKDIETFIDTVGERMFDDVSLSISSKLDSKGRFEFANSLVTLRKNVVKGGDLTRTGVHELWHSISRNLPNKDLGRLKAQFTRERNKYLKGKGKDVEDFKKGTYSDDNYRYSDIDEYFAEEMTDAFLSKLDADASLAPQGTFKRVAQEIAIMLKDMFASVKSKLGIDQRQKIFNDFVKQRNVKKQRSGPLGTGDVKKMQDVADETVLRRSGIFADRIDDSTMRLIREGFRKDTHKGKTWETVSPEGKPAPTVDNVLKSLSKNAKYPEVKELAKNLRKIIKDVNDKNVIVTASDTYADPSTIRGGARGEIAGMYSPTKDRVVLFPNADEQTLVHELLHGVTTKKLNAWVKHGGKDRSLTLENIDNVIKNRKAPKPIRELASSFKEAMQEFKRLEQSGWGITPAGKTLYSFKDLDEFLVGAFTDYDLQRMLRRMPSKDNRSVFQKIVDAVKDMLGYSQRADGSLLDKVLRDSAQIISAGRPEYIGKARLVDRGLYSMKAAVRSLSSEQLSQFRQEKNLPEKLRKDGSHPTQIASTVATYKKIKPQLNQGKTMDFGAGKNISGKANIKSDTYEPFPEKGFDPTFNDASAIPDNSYDNVINNAVLNVVPQDIRDGIVKDIGRILKPGGKGFINVRGKDVFEAKHTLINKENAEVIVDSTGAYQKGFTDNELVDYLEDVLGDGFDVRMSSNEFGKVSAVITKRSDDGLASVKGGFIDEVSPEHAGIAKAIARGETVTLPRFETTDQQHSFIEALRAEVEANPKTFEEMEKEAIEGLPVDFGDNAITDAFKNMEQTTENQRQVRLEATVYKKMGEGLVSKLHEAAKAYRESGGGDVATANLKNIFQEVVGFSEHYFRLGRETSLTLVNRRQKMGRRKLGLTESEMQGQGIRKNFVNENGKMNVEKIVSAIEENVDPDNLVESINGMFKLARQTQGRKFLDMPTEYWINSILSGPRTQMVNIIGNTLTSVLSTIEAAVGGLMSGNREVTRQAFAAWADMSMFREAMSFAGKAWKSRENLLDPDARAFNEGRSDAITPEAFPDRLTDNPRFYKTIEGVGNFLRTPSRLLMTTDEFFKQLNYRRAARFKLAMQGMEQGMTDPRQLAEYIEKGLEDVITSGGRHYSEESLIREGTQMAEAKGITDSKEQAAFVSQHVQDNTKEGASALADFALEESRYLTFTKDLDKGTLGAAIQGAQQTWSPLRFVMPFVRTPTNILAYAFERTPLGMIPDKVPFPFLKSAREKFYNDIRGNDPIAKAQAQGKLATSTAMTAVMVDMAYNNREFITGGGPKNPEEKKALEATGWKPYSIKINDTYYSYQRLDPVGTLLGVAADMVDHGLRSPKNFDQSGIDRVFSALSLTLVRNVTNKSYLAGVQMFTNALSDPERYGDRLLRNFGSSLLPFSGFLSQVQYGTGTQEAREVRSFADAFLNKLPGGRDNLDPKRNVLGESVMIENLPLIGALNPVAYSTVKNDPVLTEMASLNHAFREPRSTYGGLIDLLEYTNDSGQTAHDRRLELLQSVKIGGRTLKQALSRLIKSRNYQRLPQESEPGLPSPRIQKINSLLTKYRNEALDSAMNEFPELSQYYDQVTRAKRQYRQGADHSSVLSLLNQ